MGSVTNFVDAPCYRLRLPLVPPSWLIGETFNAPCSLWEIAIVFSPAIPTASRPIRYLRDAMPMIP